MWTRVVKLLAQPQATDCLVALTESVPRLRILAECHPAPHLLRLLC